MQRQPARWGSHSHSLYPITQGKESHWYSPYLFTPCSNPQIIFQVRRIRVQMYLQAMRMLYIYFESLTAHSKFYFCKFTIYFIIHRINTTATLHGAVTNFICSSDSSLENLPSFQLLFSNGRGRAALSLFPRRERMTSQVQTQFICLTSHEGFGIVSVPSACVFQSP